MKASSLLFAATLGGLLWVGTPAYACKCMLPELTAAREDASALFEGRVLSIEDVDGASEATNGEKKVTLAVVRTWKGLDTEERVVVFTNGSTAACGYPFAKDTSYLVFARTHNEQLTVSHCGRTKPLADAGEDLAALGVGATPVTLSSNKAASAEVPPGAQLPKPPPVTQDGAGTPAAAPPPQRGCGAGSHAMLPWLLVGPAVGMKRRRKR